MVNCPPLCRVELFFIKFFTIYIKRIKNRSSYQKMFPSYIKIFSY
ncbi:hypothetical protein HMPREF9554_02901 [Treponema phagedenis F0421]|nr:hypothetical protein HMPREF9554_02901 [Treponema phagedenis F0421]